MPTPERKRVIVCPAGPFLGVECRPIVFRAVLFRAWRPRGQSEKVTDYRKSEVASAAQEGFDKSRRLVHISEGSKEATTTIYA